MQAWDIIARLIIYGGGLLAVYVLYLTAKEALYGE